MIGRLHPVTAAAGALALLVARAAPAPGQIITGTVKSGVDPIVGATVRLLELDRVEHTGARGQFTFANVPRGTYTVFVGATGYTSQTDTVVLASGQATASFDLKASAITLKEIVISASPIPRTAQELYQSAESKSQLEFLNGAGGNFAEKISDLAGVAVRSNGSAPSRPILRGLGDNEVLVLENGLRMGDIAAFDPAHATPIEALGISKVDVVRGPAAILYGPNTIGGLVNVITNLVPTVADRPLSGTVTLEGNSVDDEYAGHLMSVYTIGHQAFAVSAGGVHAQDIRIPEGTYTDPASGARFTLDRMPQTFDRSSEAGLGYDYQGSFGTIGIGGKHYEMNYGIPGVPPNPSWQTAPPTTSRIAQQRNALELRGLFTTDGSLVKQWKVTGSYNDYTHAEFPTVEDSTGVSAPQANHFHKREFNGVLQVQHQPLGQLQGTVGLWTNIEDLTIEGAQPLGPNSLTTGVAGYAYEEYLATPTTHFQAGLRFDYNWIQTHPNPQSADSVFRTLHTTRLSNAVTASLGAIERLTPELVGSFSLARSFRAPTVQELFANGLDAASGTYSIGSAGLSAETGYGVDASLKGGFASVAFAISPYANFIHNYIYAFLRGDTIQAFPVRQFAATDARLLGFEASATLEAAARFAVTANGDYVNAEDTRRHLPLPFTPPLRGLLRGSYQDKRYSGMIEWRLAARQSRLGPGDTPTAGYAVMNLGAGVRIVQQSVVHHISIHCDNVLDQAYRDHLSVIKDFIPQPGRGFRLNYQLLY